MVDKDDRLFFKVIRSGFAQRRKTLLNSLSAGMGVDKGKVGQIFDKTGIDPARRAETLDIDEFAQIANCMAETNL